MNSPSELIEQNLSPTGPNLNFPLDTNPRHRETEQHRHAHERDTQDERDTDAIHVRVDNALQFGTGVEFAELGGADGDDVAGVDARYVVAEGFDQFVAEGGLGG